MKCARKEASADWSPSQLTRTIGHSLTGMSWKTGTWVQPPPLLQSSKYRRPAPPRNKPTRWKFLAGIRRGTLGVHVKEFGFVPRAVCVETQSSRKRAPQPRVARDSTTIRPAPPYKDQTRLINDVRQKGDNSGKEAPQPTVDTIRGTFKCCHPTATIYLWDQDCWGHVKGVRPRPSSRVRQTHDRSKDGWKRKKTRLVTGANKKSTHETEIPRGYYKMEGKEFGRVSLIKSGVERLLSKGIEMRPMAVLASRWVTWCWATTDPSTWNQQHRSSNLNTQLIGDSCGRGDRRRCLIGGTFVGNSQFRLDGVDPGSPSARLFAMSGCCAMMRFFTSTNCCKSCLLTTFFLAPVVAPFVMLCIKVVRNVHWWYNLHIWLLGRSGVCRQLYLTSDSLSALVFFMKMLSVR